jgi:hypothetical protein
MDLQKFINDNLHKIPYSYYDNGKVLPKYDDYNLFYYDKDNISNKDKIYNKIAHLN